MARPELSPPIKGNLQCETKCVELSFEDAVQTLQGLTSTSKLRPVLVGRTWQGPPTRFRDNVVLEIGRQKFVVTNKLRTQLRWAEFVLFVASQAWMG